MPKAYDIAQVWEPQFVGNVIQVLVEALEAKDSYNQGHAKRVAEISLAIGAKMGFSAIELRDLYIGAMLHDIGKIIGATEPFLSKPGQLDQREATILREHTMKAGLLLVGFDNLTHILPTILYHHERWDGSGYPNRLQGESIPLHARIVAVADAYAAMLYPRSFREAKTPEAATCELQSHKGILYDPDIVDLLLACIAEQPHEMRDFSYYF